MHHSHKKKKFEYLFAMFLNLFCHMYPSVRLSTP